MVKFMLQVALKLVVFLPLLKSCRFAGYGAGGRLGIGSTDSVVVPTLLDSIQDVFIKKISVNSGGKHCLALSADNDVYSWGEGDDGKLGHGTRT